MLSVGSTYSISPSKPNSAPQPYRRQTSAVSLLPSGPEPVPTAIEQCIPPDTPTLSADLVGQGINIRISAASKELPQPSSNFVLRILTISNYRWRQTTRT